MAVSPEYVANLVALLNADAEATVVESVVDDIDPCDDDTCLWCN